MVFVGRCWLDTCTEYTQVSWNSLDFKARSATMSTESMIWLQWKAVKVLYVRNRSVRCVILSFCYMITGALYFTDFCIFVIHLRSGLILILMICMNCMLCAMCTGLGDPAYFYVTCVFALNAFMMSLLFLYGTYLRQVKQKNKVIYEEGMKEKK